MLFGLAILFGEALGLACAEDELDSAEIFGDEDHVAQEGDHVVFDALARDAFAGAVAFAVGAGTRVIVHVFSVALFGGVPVEGGFAMGATEQAREEEARVGAARVGNGAFFELSEPTEFLLHFLDFIPEFARDDGRAVVFDDEIAEFEDADVEFVRPEGGVGIDGAVEMRFLMNLPERATRGSEGERSKDGGSEVGVGDPFVGGARRPVAVRPDVDGFALEAAGRRTRDASVAFDEFAQAAAVIGGGLFEFFFVGKVYKKFDDAGIVAFGDGVVQTVNDDAPLTDEDLVELGVVYVPREARVIP